MIKIGNFSVDEFVSQASGKNIICFCAGQKFSEVCEKYDLSSKILYLADNYAKGTFISTDGKEIPILPISKMGSEAKNCLLLITSMKYADQIITQLDASPLYDGLTFYFPELFAQEGGDAFIANEFQEKIPKILHYCWFGKGKIPKRFQRNIETWKKHCSDYEVVRWDESNYDISKNQYVRQAYEAGKWSFVSDYARVDIINDNGGIYLDTDVEVLKSFDPLLQFELFCGFETYRYVNFGSGFGAVKRNRVLEEILELYEGLEFFRTDGTWNMVTSPVYQTKILERHGMKKNGRTQIMDHVIVLAPEYLSPINQYGFGTPSVHSFSIHQYAAGWFDKEQREDREKLTRNYRFVIERMRQKQ